MKRLLRAVAAFALLVAPVFAAFAQSRGSGLDTAVTVEEEIQHHVVAEDGSFVATGRQLLRINEERAIRAVGQRYVAFNSGLETLEITEAFTQKQDGRRIAVQPDQIRDQQEPRSTGAPMFQDTRLKVIVFPDVAVGDKLGFSWRRTRTKPLWPGQFEDRAAPRFTPMERFELSYDMPASRPLQADVLGFDPVEVESPPGRRVYKWKYRAGMIGRIEAASVAFSDYGQRLVVSTFPDWSAFARAYDARAKPLAAPGEAVRALATKLTQGIDEPRAKAIALAEWVRRNIRYVAVYIGPGGVVPHAADAVLDNRYGDCKDHVTLLEALLTAAGIDSTPALINLGNAYRLGDVPSLGVLNHVITYIPSLQLFIDSTADGIAPGFLPPPDIDKPVLLTRSGARSRTPATQTNATLTMTTIDVDAKGAARIRQEQRVTGWQAETTRQALRNMPPQARAGLVQRLLQANGQNGRGELEPGDLNATGEAHATLVTMEASSLVNLPGPSGMPALSSLGSGIAAVSAGLASERERTQLFLCSGQNMVEKSVIRFPKDVSLLAVPKPLRISGGPLEFASSYVQRENELTIERRLVLRTPGAVCEPKEFNAMRPALEAILLDLKGQIVVKGP